MMAMILFVCSVAFYVAMMSIPIIGDEIDEKDKKDD